jgi:hypothetical protein
MMTTDPIKKFILKDKDNLRIATTVGEAWPEVRRQIVIEFLGNLEKRLKTKLKGLESEISDGTIFESEWAGYHFWKPSWDNQYSLCLQFCSFGQQMMIGICRDKVYLSKRQHSPKLLKALTAFHPKPESNSWWEARVKMLPPFADWSGAEVLWKMHKDKTFLNEVSAQLLLLTEITEPIIDGLVRKYKK